MKSHGLEMKGPLGSSDGVDAIEFTDVTGAVTINTDLEIDGETQLDGDVKITGGTPLAGKVLYTTDTNGTLAWKYQSVPSGKTVLFEKNTSVTGYTMQTDHDDGVAYITGSESGFGLSYTQYFGLTHWGCQANCNWDGDSFNPAGPGLSIKVTTGSWYVGMRWTHMRITMSAGDSVTLRDKDGNVIIASTPVGAGTTELPITWQGVDLGPSTSPSWWGRLSTGAIGDIENIEFGLTNPGIPGEEGGTNKSGGTWTQPLHDHGGGSSYTGYHALTISQMPRHRHTPAGGGYFVCSGANKGPGEAGDDFYTYSNTSYAGGLWAGGPAAGHRHTMGDAWGGIDTDGTPNTWRPYGRNLTRQTKN